jgi:hypothetical protein
MLKGGLRAPLRIKDKMLVGEKKEGGEMRRVEEEKERLCCIVLYCIVLYCIVLYCIVLYCIVLYCIVLYCIVLYFILLHRTMKAIQHCTVLYNTVLHTVRILDFEFH